MAKIKRIAAAAQRPGKILRLARRACNMTTDDAAIMLHVLPSVLAEYEHGITEVPQHILEHMFIMGYKMKQIRLIEARYHRQRKLLRKLDQIDTEAKQ